MFLVCNIRKSDKGYRAIKFFNFERCDGLKKKYEALLLTSFSKEVENGLNNSASRSERERQLEYFCSLLTFLQSAKCESILKEKLIKDIWKEFEEISEAIFASEKERFFFHWVALYESLLGNCREALLTLKLGRPSSFLTFGGIFFLLYLRKKENPLNDTWKVNVDEKLNLILSFCGTEIKTQIPEKFRPVLSMPLKDAPLDCLTSMDEEVRKDQIVESFNEVKGYLQSIFDSFRPIIETGVEIEKEKNSDLRGRELLDPTKKHALEQIYNGIEDLSRLLSSFIVNKDLTLTIDFDKQNQSVIYSNIEEMIRRFDEFSKWKSQYEDIVEGMEYEMLLQLVKKYNISSPKELSAFITANRIGNRFPHLCGLIRMRDGIYSWDYKNGIAPSVYGRLCEDMEFGGPVSSAKVESFTPWKDF